MYEIKVSAQFSAAHNLVNYRGKCERLHGHNWRVEAVFSYPSLGKDGIALDFREAKGLVKGAAERFDHAYLNKLAFLKNINPTSENIAKVIYDRIKRKNKFIAAVSVWENESSCATYRDVKPTRLA